MLNRYPHLPSLMSIEATFLFTDIEGSTRLWEDHPDEMEAALEWHDRVATRIVERHGGRVFKHVGDALFAVFPGAREAIEAAVEGQKKLNSVDAVKGFPLKVRMAAHTGPAQERGGDFFGASLNKLARVLAMGSGGQVLLTKTTRDELLLAGHIPFTTLIDLGEHRLRDVAQPEHIFELKIEGISDTSTSVRTLANFPNNLPVQISSFIGRDKELTDCRRLLREGRLVTLTGVGGSGKTRLALQLAAEFLGPDGAYLVELAPLDSPSLVGQSIGEVMGLRETADRAVIEVAVEYLRNRKTLLVIDNCEHMLTEATSVIRMLLQRCPQLKVLATSREPLSVQGEYTYTVPPLALPMSDLPPPAQELAGFEAVRLFVDRAAGAKSGFTLTDENAALIFDVCKRMDGIPLAIELAAARVRSMSLEQIADRLDDQFKLVSASSEGTTGRQQTLRALVDWSYDLLTPDEKLLLERLAVFVSGFTLPAAEAVCADSQLADVLSSLVRLVEKSLVQQDDSAEEPRYRLLETIRQYAWAKLVEHGATQQISSNHLRYFSNLADEAKPFLQEGNRTWIDRISREHDNIRFALDRFGNNPSNAILGVKLATAMTVFWNNRGHLTEARRRFQSVLLRSHSAPESLQAEVLMGAAVIEASLGAYTRAAEWGEQAVETWRRLGDESDLAFGLLVLGNIRIQLRDFDGAVEAYEEGMGLRIRLGETERLAIPLNNLGYVEYQRGNYAKAQQMIEEAIERSRQVGNHQIILNASHSLAMVLKDQGKLEEALKCMRESLAAAAELQHHAPIALRLEGVAYILELLGDDRTAIQLIAAADAIRKKINLPVPSLERPHHDRHVEALRSRIDSFEQEFQRGAMLAESEAISVALGSKVRVR